MKLPLLEPYKHVLPPDEFGTRSQLLAELGRGCEPIAVMLTCWELGWVPDQVSRVNSGEFFIVQNPGGLLPAADMDDDETYLPSILLGLDMPMVRHLVVCGHTQCKTLGVAYKDRAEFKANPFVELMQGLFDRLDAAYSDRLAQDWLDIVVQENILQQLTNLRSYEHIQTRLRQGHLFLHGWIRDDETSSITAYNPVVGQFCD
jgi:carbonic anhydrase